MQNGKIVYRYTVKNGKFFVHEGVINNTGFRTLVNFKDHSPSLRCPRDEEFGIIRTVGHSLWMTERDDNKARRLFINYEINKIVEMEEQIRRKKETLKMLYRGMDTKTMESELPPGM